MKGTKPNLNAGRLFQMLTQYRWLTERKRSIIRTHTRTLIYTHTHTHTHTHTFTHTHTCIYILERVGIIISCEFVKIWEILYRCEVDLFSYSCERRAIVLFVFARWPIDYDAPNACIHMNKYMFISTHYIYIYIYVHIYNALYIYYKYIYKYIYMYILYINKHTYIYI